jgi:rRNA maturation endonuclease Nob1
MAVTGIFRTPRGYAAMVEATPIKLSYTIYPGEKFFDGQLVAVEENRLVFRRVTKAGNGKFVSSVENKPLRQYSTKAQIEGTAPSQAVEAQNDKSAAPAASSAKVEPVKVVSPLEEMNKQVNPDSTEKEKAGKNTKRPVKVASTKK